MPDRKFLCTLSLFLTTLGLFTAGWFVRLPDYLDRYLLHQHNATSPLPLWLCVYVGLPLIVLGAVGGVLRGLWLGCADVCAMLRKEQR